MITKEMTAVYISKNLEMTPLSLLEEYYTNIDIVLIEGWISGPYDKIEIWRKAVKKPPLFSHISHVKAIVSDDILDTEIMRQADNRKIRCFKIDEVTQLVESIIKVA